LVVGLFAVVLVRRLGERPLDSRPLGLEQYACPFGIHSETICAVQMRI
jgi:hypothetical protein